MMNGDVTGAKTRVRRKPPVALYVCPVCGNVILAGREAAVSCCGAALTPAEAKEADEAHRIRAEIPEDEYYVTLRHPMTKEHHIVFLLAVSDRGTQFVRLYPEENAEARFRISGVKTLYAYCSRHGLFQCGV